MKFSRSNFFTGAAILLLLKLICLGFSPADAAGSLFLLLALQAEVITSHLFPKRPDLFKEVLDLQAQLNTLREKSDEMDRDLTGLKMGAMRR